MVLNGFETNLANATGDYEVQITWENNSNNKRL